MKTAVSCSLAGLALWVNTAYAGGMEGYGIPSNTSFYAGGSIGQGTHEGACLAVANGSNCENSAIGHKVFAGTRIAPNPGEYVVTGTVNSNVVVPASSLPSLGVEMGYINFGESTADGRAGRVGIFASEGSSKTSATYLAGVGYMQVSHQAELIGKAGVAFWDQQGTVAVPSDTTLNTETESDGTGLLLGGGAQVKVTPNLSIRGEYEHVFGVGKDTDYEADASLLSVGAVFSTL